MDDLEFRIGSMKQMNYEYLKINSPENVKIANRFIVLEENGIYDIYIANEYSHAEIADAYKLDQTRRRAQVVGGGSVYINKEKQLVVGHNSEDYKSIPKDICLKFGKLIRDQLIHMEYEINEIVANPGLIKNTHWQKVIYK